MTYDLLTALAAFALGSSITPGPNYLMLMASGANYGVWRTLPHMLGVALGFVFMVILVGVGLIQIFDLFPVTYTVLKVVSVGYLLYLAWKIATAAAPDAAEPTGAPMAFLQAAAFQWVNPKAWTMALTAISGYTVPSAGIWGIFLVGVVFGAINLPSVGLWAWMGQQLRKVLEGPRRLRAFNITMAVLLVASLYPILWP
mgnify:CR=1 FL=1